MKTRGFTLLEVMVALVIFTGMAITLSRTASQSVDTLLYLQDKTLASMIAENRMAELKLAGFPALGERKDQLRFASRQWQLLIKVEATQFPDTHRVTVSVATLEHKDSPLVSLASIMGKQG